MLGPPGAGKGTIGALLSKSYGIPTLSTGDMIRAEIAAKTGFGNAAKEIIDKGKLIADRIIIKKLIGELKKPCYKNGVILDGFPRTLQQAKALKKYIAVDAVLELAVNDKTILERLTGRRTCEKCSAIYHIKTNPPKKEGFCDRCGGKLYQRSDQKPDIIKERLDEYAKKTKLLVDYYLRENLLLKIDAEEPPEEILQNVLVLLKDNYPI